MKIRIYKTPSGEVVVDTPSMKYQSIGIDKCPHPDRFRDGKEPFELEIKELSEIEAIVENKNEAGSAQFYYDDSKKLCHDHEWNELVMPESCILKRHKEALNAEIAEELAKENPDVVKLFRKDRELKELPKLSKEQILELALSKLEAQGKKPKIQEKLRKILNRSS